MGTDDLFKRTREERKKRTSKQLKLKKQRWLIVCEGTKTEPNYFKQLIDFMQKQSNLELKYDIFGTGRNTESLVNYVDLLTDVSNYKRKKIVDYDKVFVVFDKDSFKETQFNNAIIKSQNNGYIPIWSNECVELWFLLHFIYFDVNIPRQEYYKKLEKCLKCKYKKSDNHFEIISNTGDIKCAYKNAKKLYEKNKGKTYSKMTPCTMMFQFIEELEKVFQIKIVK